MSELRFTKHARERLAEMGVSTKTIKEAWRDGVDIERPSPRGTRVAACGEWWIVLDPREFPDGTRRVVTVAFRNAPGGEPVTRAEVLERRRAGVPCSEVEGSPKE